jgi:mono/diheme cytochrome c family protein
MFVSFVLSISFIGKEQIQFDKSDSVNDVLIKLGKAPSDKKPNMIISGVSAEVGEDIVKHGFSKRKGFKKSKRQSKHFVCLSCHNIEKEDPDLTKSDPEARLVYTNEKGLPFLQGTTLYGAVNRDSYYNDDYYKKYGELVVPARDNIRESIQLCATECSQGRKLKDWELESVLAYLWTIDLKMGDIDLSEEESIMINTSLNQSEASHEDMIRLIESKYLSGSPANFLAPPEDRTEGFGLEGNTDNGKMIYENSCLHCHYQKKYSFLNLDNTGLSFNYLNKKIATYSRYSIYQVIGWGVPWKHGKKAYMPHYPAEKMSKQQVEDLRAYIEMKAK